jgi:hypothetical protein
MSTLLFARWACRAVVALLLLAAAVGAESAEPKPNVLILVSDDQGWGDLGVQGAADLATPNLDAIARQGVRFTDGYWGRRHVPSMVCCDNGDILMTAYTCPNDGSDQMAIITTRHQKIGMTERQSDATPANKPKHIL